MNYDARSVAIFAFIAPNTALAEGWLMIGLREPGESALDALARLTARLVRILKARAGGSKGYRRFTEFELRQGERIVIRFVEIDTPEGKVMSNVDVEEAWQATQRKTSQLPLPACGQPADTTAHAESTTSEQAQNLPARSSECCAEKTLRTGSLVRGPKGRFQSGAKPLGKTVST